MSHLCVQACWLFLKNTYTQIASLQVMIYLLVGSKFILRTNLNIFMLAKSILATVKTAREGHVRPTFPFLIFKIIFLLD